MISLTTEPIDLTAAYQYLQAGQAGAINYFLGTVRDNSDTPDVSARPVDRLDYEAYDWMAAGEMQKIVNEATRRWPALRVVVVHRTGTLLIGDIAVLIGVATPHRAESFAACRYIIDTLKETVPIWKKEIFLDGEVWIKAHL